MANRGPTPAPPIISHKDLEVWQSAMDLAAGCTALTRSFRREELFGMTSRIRRASVLVAANIAEGHGREHPGSFMQSLRLAQGSPREAETHRLLALRVGLTHRSAVNPVLDRWERIGRMLLALIRSLQRRVG